MPSSSSNANGGKTAPCTGLSRSPRTISEADISYVGSQGCVRCILNHWKCIFKEENKTQKCIRCENHGLVCQLIGSSFIRKNKQSKLGRRSKCNCCVAAKRSCAYEDDGGDEWNYNISCSYCKTNGKCCWPLINFRGMRANTSKMFSGVDDSFVSNNALCHLLACTTFEAAANFKPTVDYPMNCKGIISSLRPRRARNNYGIVKKEINLGDQLYHEIISYGSGCGATSVGTTYNTNYLRPLTQGMDNLCAHVQTILREYTYLAPFLKQDFNHVQFSINGGKGITHINPPAVVQTGMHCDTIFSFSKERGIHCLQSKNSQAPNSIVAILTVGHSRILTMERVKWENGPTDQVLETRHFVLSHGSLFVLHPLDERPSVRDGIMSYWKHGDVRLACTNPFCKDRCVAEQCRNMNYDIVSFSLALRTCCHSRIINPTTSLEPLHDDVRSALSLETLDKLKKERNEEAEEMLSAYERDGSAETFKQWLHDATKRVMHEFYPKINLTT